jgi:transposase
MANKTHRPPLILSKTHRHMLSELSRSTTAPERQVKRARVLLKYADGCSIAEIQRQVGISAPTIYKCIDTALADGVEQPLKPPLTTKKPEILDDAKDWVIGLARSKPGDYGLSAERWSLRALTRHVAEHAVDAGFPRLANAGKTTVWRILKGRRSAGAALAMAASARPAAHLPARVGSASP